MDDNSAKFSCLNCDEMPFSICRKSSLLFSSELHIRVRKVDRQPECRLVAVIDHLVLEAVVNDDNLTLLKWNLGVFADSVFEQIWIFGNLEERELKN